MRLYEDPNNLVQFRNKTRTISGPSAIAVLETIKTEEYPEAYGFRAGLAAMGKYIIVLDKSGEIDRYERIY